ncbi:MAG TPA: hypothetical protein VKA06_05550, partial [Spirochaetia bacterium]|nr:hypothetical protein [Spirochaetia bacterium]
MHHQSPQNDLETLRRYLAATSAVGPHWSADGSALAFVWNDPGSHHVYVATFDSTGEASMAQVTSGDDRCTDPRFLPTGELVYTSDSGGNENFQLFVATPGATPTPSAAAAGAGSDGWRTRRLTEDDGAKYRVVSISDREVLFIANDRDRSRFTLYAQPLPLSGWAPQEIFTPERGVPESAERLADGSLAVALAFGNMSQELVLVEPAYRSLTAGLSGDGEVRWSFLREASDG